ncbi:MAG: hypothetical protein ABSD88_09760 [Candidatus Korobacteraceae bacterium]
MLSYRLEFHPESDEQFFEQLPSAPAVFALRGEQAQAEAYISKTANLRRRARRLLAQPANTTMPTSATDRQMWGTRLNLRHRVRWLEYSPTGSDFESGFLLYKLWRHEFPEAYQKRLRLRPAPLLRLILENRYPRLVITTRIAGLHGRRSAADGAFAFAPTRSAYYGPFPTRAAAEKFANDTLDLFKVRRCIEELDPDPAFPGCIYSEMKMCLAPCFRGCTDEAYAEEVAQLEQFLASGGRSLLQAVAAERDRASEQLEFETAAATHARFERIQALTRELPEIVRRLDRLRGLMIQPSAQPGAVALFRIEEGRISDPITFAPAALAAFTPAGAATATAVSSAAPQSMEARLREAVASVPPAQLRSAQEAMEHLAMLKRWYYRTYKVGELFLSDDRGELPMRRIVRGVARVLKGEAPPEDQGIGIRDLGFGI